MEEVDVNYSKKAQMKIQQMAFMLVAVAVFFALVALIYLSVSLSGLKNTAVHLQDQEAKETVQKIAGVPELTFTSGGSCSSCIDLNKALAINPKIAEELWNFDYLEIKRIYSKDTLDERDCTPINFNADPTKCDKITLINKIGRPRADQTAFVTLVYRDNNGRYIYELGRIHASATNPIK